MVKKYFILLLLIFLPFFLYAFTQEKELFSEAESRYLSNNYALAFELYDDFVKKFPLSELIPDAQYRKALCLFRLGQFDESITVFNVVEKRYRTTGYIDFVPFWKGVAQYQIGEYQPAVENLKIFLERGASPDLKGEALLYRTLAEVSLGTFLKGQKTMAQVIELKGYDALSPYEAVLYSYILLKVKDYDSLIRFSERIDPALFPPEWNEKILLHTAEGYWQSGNRGEAEKKYSLLLNAQQDTASIAFRRLYSLAQSRGDFPQMEWIVQQAEIRFADHPEILRDFWMGIGIESYKRKEFDLAAYFLRKVWNLSHYREMPEAVPLYLAEIFIMKGKPDTAREVLEKYLESAEGSTGLVYFRLGTLFLGAGNYAQAAEIFTLYTERYPQGGQIQKARYLLAYSEYKQDQLENALRLCTLFLEQGGEEELTGSVVKLKMRVLMSLKNNEEALQTIKKYLETAFDDKNARLDELKLIFTMRDYQGVILEAERLLAQPDLDQSDLYVYLNVKYLTGLARISLKQYREALSSLSEITIERVEKAGLVTIFPFALYYRAWALYRMNNLKEALSLTEDFLSKYEGHELYSKALYLGAWCFFSRGEYRKAQELFSQLAGRQEGELSEKALFLEGKSLDNLKRRKESSLIFSEIYREYPDSPYADDALFENANIFQESGDVVRGAEGYFKLWDTYPESQLAEEALYKRGEAYFSGEYYKEAKNAFHDYRVHFPNGKLTDASLYWEGYSAQKLGEERGAVVLWEKVIDLYKKSSFRPDALRETSELYVRIGDYRKASRLYTVLLDEYPVYSEGVNADLRLEEIRYLLFGLNRREAELTAIISRKQGVETKEGRRAMNELASLYISEENAKQERAFQLLSQVLQQDDAETSQEAGILLGEYYYKNGDLERAGREFFNASLKNPGNRDLMAYSIYRAAQMMKLAGKAREARKLVERLQENFPSSSWSDEGKRLLEEVDE